MAKYTINYNCGHSGEVQLYGPGRERERKIEWMEGRDCPSCYGRARRAENDAKPLGATLIYNPFSDGVWFAITEGNTYAVKDQLKAAGLRWSEYQDNSDVLGVRAPRKAWMLKVADKPSDQLADQLAAAITKLKGLGVININADSSLMARISYEVTRKLQDKEVAHGQKG